MLRIPSWAKKNSGEDAARAPALLAAIEAQRREGFGWRWDGLDDWSTEEIFGKLEELGVDTDAARFREQAQAAGGWEALSDAWRSGAPPRGDLWDDFFFSAAAELWRRLAPDVICPDVIAERVDPALKAASERVGRRTPEEASSDLDAALVLVGYLEGFPAEERAERYEELCHCRGYDYGLWLLEAILNHGTQHPDEVTRIADVMFDAEKLNANSYQGDLAEALARAGRREEALIRIRRNLERGPDEIQTLIRAGDAYEAMNDVEQALALFARAMQKAEDEGDWGWAADRISWLLEKVGRADEMERFELQYPKPETRPHPAQPVAITPAWGAAAKPKRAAAQTPPVPAAKPSEPRGHAPCPCGSGKKYRDCCRKPRLAPLG